MIFLGKKAIMNIYIYVKRIIILLSCRSTAFDCGIYDNKYFYIAKQVYLLHDENVIIYNKLIIFLNKSDRILLPLLFIVVCIIKPAMYMHSGHDETFNLTNH